MARGDNTAEMKFRLPGDLHARIEAAASANQRNASEEVRRRLQASFGDTTAAASNDPNTRELLVAISEAATDIREIYGKSWHEDPWAREALLAALRALVEIGGPSGDPQFNPAPGSRAASSEYMRDPHAVGEVIALRNPFPQTGRSNKA
jgi:hypothetical protein